MPKLSLALLGPFQATLDGRPLLGLTSAKARALLAYLAVESGRAHSREALATLLSPEYSTEAALNSLRHALAHLRRILGEPAAATPHLLVRRDALQFNPAGDHWLDIAAFRALLVPDESGETSAERLEEAIALYRGDFLAGFATGASPAFDDWLAIEREELARQTLSALQRLAAVYESRGDLVWAEACYRRQLALAPWQEEAHRELMRLLALSGQRSAALAQYEACKRALKAELGVEPARETTGLYQQIRDGELSADAALTPTLSQRERNVSLLASGHDQDPHRSSLFVSRHSFVGRERELAWLDAQLAAMLEGQGRVAFVTGEPGSGKTALLAEFARRAMQAHGNLVAAFGSCNAQTGLGDPYLPFRDILQMLTSDVEATRAADSVSPEHARRLWALLPEMLQVLVEAGPDLLDQLVPGRALLARAQAFGPSITVPLARLEKLVQRKAPRPGAGPQQSDLFEQVTRVLQQLAKRPAVGGLVLVLDDLQWADRGSASLLFHLGRRLAGSPILVLGAYRPEDVALGRGGERHPPLWRRPGLPVSGRGHGNEGDGPSARALG